MKKTLLILLILASQLYGELTNVYPSQKLLDSKIPIVDIRTKGEWIETGLLKGSITIMFFDERGGYDINKFLQELNQKVDTKKQFALICRTGSRTMMVSQFLSDNLKYNVVNLLGGILSAKSARLEIEKYRKI